MEETTNYTKKGRKSTRKGVILERREAPRVAVSFPIKCVLLPERRKFFYTVSKDLSLKGIRIISKDFLIPGKKIMVYIDLIKEIAHVKAKVIWSNKVSYTEKYYVGLQFLEISRDNRQKLLNFLNEIQMS